MQTLRTLTADERQALSALMRQAHEEKGIIILDSPQEVVNGSNPPQVFQHGDEVEYITEDQFTHKKMTKVGTIGLFTQMTNQRDQTTRYGVMMVEKNGSGLLPHAIQLQLLRKRTP